MPGAGIRLHAAGRPSCQQYGRVRPRTQTKEHHTCVRLFAIDQPAAARPHV